MPRGGGGGVCVLCFVFCHAYPEISAKFILALFFFGIVSYIGEEIMGIIAYTILRVLLITILVSGSQPGLQDKNKKGEWIDVKSEKGQLIINIGDMLQECSNGYYPSTEHQVTNPKIKNNVSRFSLPLFMHPRDDVILSKKYTAASYLLERLKELGLK